jgi:Tfp pilus assembly protein PilO
VKSKLSKLSPAVASVLVGVGALVVLAAGLYVVVLPQSHKASKLKSDVASTKAQIVAARALSMQKPEQRIRAADLFKVVEAMPDQTDMTDTILQLQQTAGEAGLRFDSIAPGVPSAGAGYDIQPIDLVFRGNYFSLTDFLFRLRRLVEVHDGKLDATGRLFSVGKIDFEPADTGFPKIAATVTVNTFVYDPVSQSAAAAASTGSTSTTTTSTDTTTTTTTSDAQASGATS